MADLRTYSATVGQAAPLVHLRLNETSGTTASDAAGGLTGAVQLDAPSIIGDGAMGFAGSADFIRIDTLSGTITVSAFGDSLTARPGSTSISCSPTATSIPADDRFRPPARPYRSRRRAQRVRRSARMHHRGAALRLQGAR